MKKISLCFFLFSFSFFLSFSQPQVEWQSDFSKSNYDRPYGLCANAMGEIMVCGETWNDSNQTYDGTVMKLDFAGNKIWQKNFGYGGTEYFTCIAAVSGGYVLCGKTSSKGAGSDDFWLVKIDESGNLLWEKTYGSNYDDKAQYVLETKTGDLLVCGNQMTVSSSSIAAWVLKLNSSGEKIWDKKIGGHFRCYAQSAGEMDGKFIIAGYIEPNSYDKEEKYKENKARLTALDQNGNTVWDKVFVGTTDPKGEEKDDEFADVTVSGNEIIACGYNESKSKNGYEDMWVMKLNAQGEMQWEQFFGGINEDKATALAKTEDGIVLCGKTESRETGSTDISVVKFSNEGKLLWSSLIGKEMNESPYKIISTADGGFAIAAEKCTHYNYDSKPVKCSMNIIKLAGTPEKSVENYVNLKVKAWEKKGEFEKTDAYQTRVNDENRKKIIEKHTHEAIAYYAGTAVDFSKSMLGNYDADKEEFSVSISGLGNFPAAVSVDNAQSFKENFSSVQFENPEYSIKDEKFHLEKVLLVNGGKEFSYNAEKNKFILTGERKAQADLYRGTGDPLKGLNVSKTKSVFSPGKYFALIIGVDNYKGTWPALQNAVHDAQAVELLLKNKYKFDNFKTLYDEQATRANIMNALEWLVDNTQENDNVFIYYSGHGEFKKELNKGYWVPADAQTASLSAYISNNDLQTFLGGIKSKHTLLVSDACFSGDIFRGNTVTVKMDSPEKYYTETYNLKSRQAMTSGGIEPVMDGGKEGHSIFAYYFLQALKNNEGTYLDASQLYDKLKIPVTNNSEQKPNLQPVKNAGDEGGQFIFIRK
ncbi:MAG: caspase family protein [Bacteroidetes bacterium]|nr:caspase family protein [Bacteroidota bacterium]